MSDHVFFPEQIESAYPYTEGGKPYWSGRTDWPDPWVLIGAMAAVTTNLRFSADERYLLTDAYGVRTDWASPTAMPPNSVIHNDRRRPISAAASDAMTRKVRAA